MPPGGSTSHELASVREKRNPTPAEPPDGTARLQEVKGTAESVSSDKLGTPMAASMWGFQKCGNGENYTVPMTQVLQQAYCNSKDIINCNVWPSFGTQCE